MRARSRSGLTAIAIFAGVCAAALAATAAVATTATPAATNTAVTSVAAAQSRLVAPAFHGISQVPRPGRAVAGRVAGGVTPAASSPQDSFSDVSCLNFRDCIGVGGNDLGDGGFGSPLVGLWNGTAWKTSAPSLPSGASGGELYGISCRPGGCVAVGYYYRNSQSYTPLAELWTGAKWVLLRQPILPTGAANALLGVISCTTPKSCAASGVYQVGKATAALLETWNGTAWATAHLGSPGKVSSSALSSVSCATAAYCVAVGTYVTGTNAYTLAEVLSGGAWRVAKTVNPNTATGFQDVLQGVSCAPGKATTPMCVAVGSVGVLSGRNFFTTGFSESWNGATWTPQTVTWPSGSHSILNGVSCPTSVSCVAVGGTGAYATYNDGHAAAQSWNGTTWSLATLPTASGGIGSVLFAVQCLPTAVPTCAAAGEVGPFTTAGHALSGFWSGTAWKLVTTA